MKFSLCMIVKNEEAVLERCLESVKGVFDEIIIADTGSADRTKEIAAKYTDRIYDYAWCDDFSAARNFSFSKAVGDYIMWLDADDIIDEKNRELLISLKQKITFETNAVMMKYAVSFDSEGKVRFFYYRERLLKRLADFRWNGFVHESITPSGNILYEDITVCHKPLKNKKSDPQRNLRMYEKRISLGAKFTARDSYYYARELYFNGKTEQAAKRLEEFLALPNGWYADKIGACQMLYEIYSAKFPQKAYERLIKSLSFGDVSPQTLCLIGDCNKNSGRISQAVFWYQSALSCSADYRTAGFVVTEYERYYPLLQLCVCFDMLGDYEKAEEYNRLAGIENPESEPVKYNTEYFEKRKNGKI